MQHSNVVLVDLHQHLAGRTLPTELRLFKAGPNETKKGTFLVDALAIDSVLERFHGHGVDLAFDIEHASHDPQAPIDARGAAGWFKLGARNGEIWAVAIEWVSQFAEAIRAKRWRYLSPAFLAEKATNRVLEIVNCAITNEPATRNAQPIVTSARGPGPNTDALVASYARTHGLTTEHARQVLARARSADSDSAAFDVEVRAYAAKHGCTESEAIVALTNGAEPPSAA